MNKSEIVKLINEIICQEVANDRCNICKNLGGDRCPNYCELESGFELSYAKLNVVSEKIATEIIKREETK